MKLNKYLFNTVNNKELGRGQRSVVCISSMCLVQCFPSSHCLRLAFGSFFHRRILAVFCCSFKPFFLSSLSSATLGFLCNRFFVIWGDNFGGTFVLAFGHGCLLGCFVCYFMVWKFDNSFSAVFLPRRIDCGFAFTCLAVKWLTNLAIKQSNELSGLAVHELSGSSGSQA